MTKMLRVVPCPKFEVPLGVRALVVALRAVV